MNSDAKLSKCGKYRYALRRWWDASLPMLGFVMLNPSTADATADDPTIRRCMGFAHRESMGGIVVVNLFAYRSKDPNQLSQTFDPVGRYNDRNIWHELRADNVSLVLAAWGAIKPWQAPRARAVMVTHSSLPWRCLGMTKAGHPRHPLFVPAGHPFEPFQPETIQ